jgi:hypothetical protein
MHVNKLINIGELSGEWGTSVLVDGYVRSP